VHDDVTPTGTENLIHSYSFSKVVPKFERVEGDRKHDSCLGSKSMATLEERLEEWIFNRCQGTIPQPRRVAEMNTILRDIYNDRRFLRYRNSGNPDDYEDALCLMWKHFEKNLCKTITANKSYLETRTYAVNRLLASLIGNLKNIRKKRYKEEADKEPHRMGSDGVFIDPLDELPSPEPDPEPDPEPEYDPEVVWKIFLELLAKDPKGDLKAEANTLHGINSSRLFVNEVSG
jgi:hypothetical protein